MGEREAILNAQAIARQCANVLQQGLEHVMLKIPKTDKQLRNLGSRVKLVPGMHSPLGDYVSFSQGYALAYFKALDVLAFLAAKFPEHIKVQAVDGTALGGES
jgi:hypothetical protein